MKRLHSAAALGLAFILSYTVAPRAQEELQAQIGIPCRCVHLTGALIATVNCVGRGEMSNWSCSQIGNQCFLTGTATWLPVGSPMSCAWPTWNSGLIIPTGFGTGPTSFFNPWNIPPHTQIPVQWGVLSNFCGDIRPFGASMWVVHDTFTFNAGMCTCNPNTPVPAQILNPMWTCESY